MRIKWLGHASFDITTRQNITIVTDPYNADAYGDDFTYRMNFPEADIVTLSHHHNDHAFFQAVPGNPKIVENPDDITISQVKISGISSYHDNQGGSQRGKNIIYIIDDGELKLAHLGDLGHNLDPTEAGMLAELDVMIIPVGGFFTIDADIASVIVKNLKPKIVIPMHYKTGKCLFPIADVKGFLKKAKNAQEVKKSYLEINRHNLPDETTVNVLEPVN